MSPVQPTEWPPLSKSRYVAGWQCLKRLYYQVHHRELAAPADEATQAIFDQGHLVGQLACNAFPGGVLVTEDHRQHEEAISKTNALLADSSIHAIYEAAFTFEGIKVRADILQRLPSGAWRMIEVKQSTQVKEYHLHDAAIQRYVLEGCGLTVSRCAIMHINNQYIYTGGEHDPHRLFTITDVTAEITDPFAAIPAMLAKQRKMLNEPKPPEIACGAHCDQPYQCEFKGACCIEPSIDHISNMPGLRQNKLNDLLNSGVESILDLDPHSLTNDIQLRAFESVTSHAAVYADGAGGERPSSDETIVYMDFETIGPAVPLFADTRPYQAIPFQWSVAVQLPGNKDLECYDYLADGKKDPRRDFVSSLLEVLEKHDGPIVVYHQTFEESRLKELANAFPEFSKQIDAVRRRLWDLLPYVRRTVYHPEFRGSFSIKHVFPALVGVNSGYASLAVQDGAQAGAVYLRSLKDSCTDEERESLRTSLIEYCRLDVRAMVDILNHLTENIEG